MAQSINQVCKLLEAAQDPNVKLDRETISRINAAKTYFFHHFKDNPKAFLERFTRILDGESNEEIDFKLNKAQQKLTTAMKKHRFIAAPKARQLGLTTLTNGLALHHALFVPNANVICMAYKNDNANENLRRIKTMFGTMPTWVQKLVMTEDAKIHQNQVGLWSFKSRLTKTNVKIEVASANSEDATRGKTPTFLHWTETAFADAAEDIFTSVFPALNRRKESVIILESTGNGAEGFYYRVCVDESRGFKVVFMPWHMEEKYRSPVDEISDADRVYIAELMGVKKLPDYLDDQQLQWYRETSETLGKVKCQQEYPINVEQVFLATNTSWFSYAAVQKLEPGVPIYNLDYSNDFLIQRPGARGMVYDHVQQEYEYLIACDPSEGQHDPSAITVLDPKGKEVLFWCELLRPDELVGLLNALGKHFNNAKMMVELNGPGFYVINNLQQKYMYPNLMSNDGKVGFRTAPSTKELILSTLQSYILNDTLTFRNAQLAHEMITFESKTKKAKKDEFDDAVMACAIAAYSFKLNPPKIRFVRELYSDYTREVMGSQTPQRRFII